MIFYKTQEDKNTIITKALTNRMLDQPLTQGIEYDEWFTNLIKLLQNNLSNFNEWYLKLLQGIPVEYDIANIEAPFMIYVLQYSLKQFDNVKYPDVVKAINECIRLYTKGDLKYNNEWSAAWCAARSAAWSAARSAAESAESAAWSAAYSAARTAAVSAAVSAARSAASSAAYNELSEELLRIIQNANRI